MTNGHAGVEGSRGAEALEGLLAEWARLRDAHARGAGGRGADSGGGADAAHVAAVKALAKRVVAHRATLFADNARLQAEASSDDDAATGAQIEANQRAIKACTTALSEMGATLGRANVPSEG